MGIKHPSDEFHPVLAFDGEAWDTLYDLISNRLRGYGVTLTMEDGSEVEAVLSGATYDDDTDRMNVVFYRVVDGEYPAVEVIDGPWEQAFVRRIQVA